MKLYKRYTGWLAGLVLLMAAGCQKYDTLQPVNGAAYIRIFNSIVNYSRRANGNGTQQDISNLRMLCVLIDPQQDGAGKFTGAAMIGDLLGARPFYAAPYETHPNDNLRKYSNTEYPGAYRVLLGEVVNGLDLARWAQIASGKHRMVIMRRVASVYNINTFFTDYTPAGKDTAFRVMVDTTVNLEQGAVYTMDVQNTSTADALPLQLQVRRETLNSDRFSTDSLYINFYNCLQAPGNPEQLDVYYQWEYVVSTTNPLTVRGINPPTYSTPIPNGPFYTSVLSPEQKLVSITGKFAATAPYAAVAMPPLDSFYYHEGPGLGQFRVSFDRPHFIINYYLPGQSAATGAKPYAKLMGNEYDVAAVLNVSNTYRSAPIIGTPYQTMTMQGISKAFPLVSTITLMNNFDYINQPLTTVSAFQISLQRPYEGAFMP